MGDLEKGGLRVEDLNTSDEAAAAKLWTVYISEAEKYDKALVESWKSDMGGMLIFAGLFSASLTAFLIESYKTLSPSSGDTTVLLLSQISLQLAASANSSAFSPVPPTPFTPPTTSLVCNALWFVSLGFSLSSALIATLLDQWARDFLHRSEMRSAPVVRARIFSYLYYGLKRFNMHAVVEVIPLLLHASLLLFLTGLVAFLLPVNRVITGVVVGLLALLFLIYCTLTVLPMLYLDCPYRTPLSGLLWRLLSAMRQTLWPAANDRGTPTVVEAMVEAATRMSDERTNRDHRALIWTVKSLADDTELEPFVESIPDILWGPNGRRRAYDRHIATLIENPDTHLMTRMERLLLSAHRGLLLPEAEKRRQIACHKALWAIAPALTHLNFNPSLLYSLPEDIGDPTIEHYSVSARYQLQCSIFRLMDNRMDEIIADLNQCQAELLHGRLPSFAGPLESLVALEQTNAAYLSRSHVYFNRFAFNTKSQPPSDVPGFQLYLDNAMASIQRYRDDASWLIFLQYLGAAGSLSNPPFEFEHTQRAVQDLPHFSYSNPCSPILSMFWEHVVDKTVLHLQARSDVPEEWTDRILGILLSLWVPDTDGRIIIPHGLVNYLNRRKLASTRYSEVSQKLDFALFLPAITKRLSGPSADDCLTALWYYFQEPHPDSRSLEDVLETYDCAVAAVLSLPPSPASHSVAVLLKSSILKHISDCGNSEVRISKQSILAYFNHPLLPAETYFEPSNWPTTDGDDTILSGSQFQSFIGILNQRIDEARFRLLAEFLEICSNSVLPFKVMETLKFISFQPSTAIHVTIQRRFANCVNNVFEQQRSGDLIHGIIHSGIFDIYTQYSDPGRPWSNSSRRWLALDDHSALQMVRDSFTAYFEIFSSGAPSEVRERVRHILQGFDNTIRYIGAESSLE
ncbi:hypothetical protein C8J57DRAFT_1196534 [Mycena rebaudengoi]|nr:hypothetical protein C8J57DRAFT_1196534 [Mycena rebaudengoi]